jgi:hypothetical protein
MRVVLMAALLAVFPACSSDATGQPCGGNVQNPPKCPSGYSCVSADDGALPVGDVGGVCKKD